MSKHWTDKLVAMNACPDAVEWARGHSSLAAAWKACKRADWMLWLAGELCRTVPQRKLVTLAACACARTALKYVPKGEKRPLVAIQITERWVRGTHGVTIDDVRDAGTAARAAGAAARAARDAARAARAAARAAGAAAWDARDAARAAGDAAWAAGDAAWAAGDAARTKALARMSNIVRQHYPKPPSLRGEEER
jgi:hypothetical protein